MKDNRYVVKELATGEYVRNPRYWKKAGYTRKTPYPFSSRMEAQRMKNRATKAIVAQNIQAPDFEVISMEDL